MKILLRHTSIDFSNYDCAVLHEIFSVISFRKLYRQGFASLLVMS